MLNSQELIPRWRRAAPAARLAFPLPIGFDLASTYWVGLGVFWFVTRSYA